jgi:hypothetical protein
MLEQWDLSKLFCGVLNSIVNELTSELEAGLDLGLNTHDWANSVTEESCLTSSFQNSIVPLPDALGMFLMNISCHVLGHDVC